MTRAFTHISHGIARIGNARCERHWSAFMGGVAEFRQVFPGKGYVEWIETPGEDLELALSGVDGPTPEWGAPEWSETCSATGAALAVRRRFGPLVVTSRVTAPHELPGLFREITLLNTGSAPVPVARLALERLPLRRDGAGVLTEGPALRAVAASGVLAPCGAVAAELGGLGGLGILLGMEAGGRFELFDPDPAHCALVCADPPTLQPAVPWTAPATFCLFYLGAVELCVQRELAAMLAALRGMRRESARDTGDAAE
ncbi:MAG: hypothetical protein GX580_09975 [Candidatus Hydrogenedens sp.]|nr:hypothetical protein [Candidatus Hydrogenedentota bacterium]NLF57955.1 hypothetical protein [Candidatus Hydrogenedens sp.]